MQMVIFDEAAGCIPVASVQYAFKKQASCYLAPALLYARPLGTWS